jgi:hypothetical protein
MPGGSSRHPLDIAGLVPARSSSCREARPLIWEPRGQWSGSGGLAGGAGDGEGLLAAATGGRAVAVEILCLISCSPAFSLAMSLAICSCPAAICSTFSRITARLAVIASSFAGSRGVVGTTGSGAATGAVCSGAAT